MKWKIIFALFLFYCCNSPAAVSILPNSANSNQTNAPSRTSFSENGLLDSLFEGGSEAYFDIIKKNIRYPMNSSKNKIQGSLIFSIHLSPTSGVQLDFLTKLDTDIENAVKNAISRTEGLWNTEEEYTLYQTMFFSIGEPFSDKFKEKISSFKKNYDGLWLEPTTVSTRGTSPKQKLGNGATYKKGPGRSVGNKLKRQSSYPVVYDADPFSEYKSALSKYTKSLKKGKSESAYDQICKVICFNPFDFELIESRQKLAVELGKTEFKNYDQLLVESLKVN